MGNSMAQKNLDKSKKIEILKNSIKEAFEDVKAGRVKRIKMIKKEN